MSIQYRGDSMRKVEVSEFYTPEPDKNIPKFPIHTYQRPKQQTRPVYSGTFLGWGSMLEEGNDWGCALSAGIIEKEDGTVKLVYPELIRFLEPAETDREAINIIFDGPPGPECGRFVEVETDDGRSVYAGEWSEYEEINGVKLWKLRITDLPMKVVP